MKKPILVDLRNIYEAKRMAQEGFEYTAVGRAAQNQPVMSEVEQ